jgi:hypothetical protein
VSLIASAYGLTWADLRAIGDRLARQPEAGFWDLIRERRIGTPREGSLFLTLDEFLRSRGVELPVNPTPGGSQALVDDGHVLALVSGAEAAATSSVLRGLDYSDEELRRFWEELNGLEAPQAGEAMREGIRWLAEVFAVGAGFEWCLVEVG